MTTLATTIHESKAPERPRPDTHRDRNLRAWLERQRAEILRVMRDRIRSAGEATENAHLDESALSDVVDDLDVAVAGLKARWRLGS